MAASSRPILKMIEVKRGKEMSIKKMWVPFSVIVFLVVIIVAFFIFRNSSIKVDSVGTDNEFNFMGFCMGASQQKIIDLVGEKNIYKQKPFSSEEETEQARNEKKWVIQNRERFIVWERLNNWKYTNALSTTLAFENNLLKEVAVYWEYSSINEAELMYYLTLRQIEDDYGKFMEGITTKTDGIVRSHSKTVSTPYVVNIILRDIGGKYLLKLNAIKSNNPEKYVTGVRVFENEGDFSYIPPKGWQVQANNISKFKTAYGPRANNFSPNICFGQEIDSRTLKQYVSDNLQYLNKMGGSSIAVIEPPISFITNKGIQGFRITYVLNSKESIIRVRQYYFQHGSRKTIATCAVLADSNYDTIFDESMKTMSFE